MNRWKRQTLAHPSYPCSPPGPLFYGPTRRIMTFQLTFFTSPPIDLSLSPPSEHAVQLTYLFPVPEITTVSCSVCSRGNSNTNWPCPSAFRIFRAHIGSKLRPDSVYGFREVHVFPGCTFFILPVSVCYSPGMTSNSPSLKYWCARPPCLWFLSTIYLPNALRRAASSLSKDGRFAPSHKC